MLLMLRDSWFKQKKKERLKKKVYLKLLDPTICSHMKERSKKVGGRVWKILQEEEVAKEMETEKLSTLRYYF